jgi:hypothetical protein
MTLGVFLEIYIILKAFRIESKLSFILSTLYAGFAYIIYHTNYMKSYFLEVFKIESELRGLENNPNICDGYLGDLDIIKIN